MNIEKYTERSRGFIQSAQSLAMREGHQQFSPLHLLKVLLDDSEGLAGGLIDRAGGNSRAILKATDMCAQEPEKAAQLVVQTGYASNYKTMLQILREVSYGAWRSYDPENTMRFFAVQLHEVGMLKGSPHKLISKGSDWRFLNELKQELKA